MLSSSRCFTCLLCCLLIWILTKSNEKWYYLSINEVNLSLFVSLFCVDSGVCEPRGVICSSAWLGTTVLESNGHQIQASSTHRTRSALQLSMLTVNLYGQRWSRDSRNFLVVCNLYMPSVLWRCWLGGRKGIRPVKTEWWGVGMVIGLELGADLHMAQLMPLPLTVSCFSKIQIGFTFLVPAHPGSPRKGPLNGCVCVYNSYMIPFFHFAVIQHSTDGCSVLP